MKYQHIEKLEGVIVQGHGVTGKDGIIETKETINNASFVLVKEEKKETKKSKS